MAPPDPIISLTTQFKADKFEKKVNLGVGAYRDENGKPFVFPIVRKVEQQIVNEMKLDKEYSPIDGNAEFCAGARRALFGDHQRLNDGTIVSMQGISGTGSLSLLAQFL